MSQKPESISSQLAASPAPVPGDESGLAPDSGPETAPDRMAPPAAAAEPAPPPTPVAAPQQIPRWLERAELFLRVLLRLYLGLALCYVPWSRMFWDHNSLFIIFPTLANIASNGAVRGMISGLGLLNLWIAFQDAIRHRDE